MVCRQLRVLSTIHLSWSLLGDFGTLSGDGQYFNHSLRILFCFQLITVSSTNKDRARDYSKVIAMKNYSRVQASVSHSDLGFSPFHLQQK